MDRTTIRTENLGKQFGDRWAISGLDLEIGAGEVFGFLGPNGAGKTTTVRMLAGLIAPTTGRAWVAGAEVGSENSQVRRSIGLLTESPGLYEKLSAATNLEFFAKLYGLPDDERRRQAERYLRLLGLWERRDEPVAAFSKGMKQRLALARAVIHEPPVLFLDEPTSGLDPAATRLVREFIADLRRAGRTIFLTTHNLDEARRLADRVAIVRQTILRVATPRALEREATAHEVVIRLSEGDSRFLAIANALPVVRGASLRDGQLLVHLEDADRDTPDVVRWLVQAGAAIQRVAVAERTLEDAYLEIIGRESVGETGDGTAAAGR